MKVKYPTWVEEQLKVIDEIIMSMYDVKLSPDQIETRMQRVLREQINPLIAEKVRLITNSNCAYICNVDGLSSSTRHQFFNSDENKAHGNCDTCAHSDEVDGSNCYECIKGMIKHYKPESEDK